MKQLALLAAIIVLMTPTASAQHDHVEGEVETFLVEGLRVDNDNPPPGSAVGRAAARFPGGGYMHVVYGKPYRRGRVIFGGLVGYGQVWSTGAHRSTELVVTVPVTIGGEPLEPGVYSLFTTPRPDRWTLHLNTVLGMHLADEYDAANDVLTTDAQPEVLEEPVDAFTIDFIENDSGVDLRIQWDETAVRFPVRLR